MRLFSVIVPDTEGTLDRLVTLPGWSHWTEAPPVRVFYYPFTEHARRAYFYAAHRRAACKALDRAAVHCLRPVDEGRPVIRSSFRS